MAVTTKLRLSIDSLLETSLDMAVRRTLLNFLREQEFSSGTGDGAMDTLWFDENTLAATTKTYALDALTDNFTASFAEVGLWWLYNKGTAAGHTITVGNATNPAYVGLFTTSTHVLKCPPGLTLWQSYYDGGGLTVTPTTGMNFKLDSGANSITYQLGCIGRSA